MCHHALDHGSRRDEPARSPARQACYDRADRMVPQRPSPTVLPPSIASVVRRLRRSLERWRTALRALGLPAFTPIRTARAAGPRVTAIVDEFTEECLRHEWQLALLGRKDWRAQIESVKPAFLFVESAWRANRGAWNYALTRFQATPEDPLYELILYCRSVGLPTVFWAKEDPPNFDVFKSVAKEFDYIFTTDADCIPGYRALCGHDRVYPLPFAAQPVLHNPAGRSDEPARGVAFTGGWYGDKHEARRRYLEALLDGVKDAGLGLTIFDRFSDLPRRVRSRHRFPRRFAPHVRPKLSYRQTLTAYRRYPTFINVNSVTDSPTMFSRRVFELLACGTNVVSSPSVGMERMLPGLVSVAATRDEARQALLELHADPAAARRRAHVGYRTVMRYHTYGVRAAEVVSRVAPALASERNTRPVSVILATNRPERLRAALENYRRQTYPAKELILVLNSDRFRRADVEEEVRDIPDVTVLQLPEDGTLAACLNEAIRHASGDYWAKMDDDDAYGAEYLWDAVLPFSYTDASIVGKGTYFARIVGEPTLYLRHPGRQHQYVKLVCGGTLVVDRLRTKGLAFDETIARGADTRWIRQAVAKGHRVYSADPYNFIQMRNLDPSNHTWTIERETYLRTCEVVSERDIEHYVFL